MSLQLFHSCTVTPQTEDIGSENEYGEPVFTGTPVTYACHFFYPEDTDSGITDTDSGKHSKIKHMVILPPDAVVERGYLLTSSVAEFSHNYVVDDVQKLAKRTGAIHHIECRIEVVE